MAKIKPIHGEMSGSIAGNTWSRNRGGQYVRQRSRPTNPNTVRQQLARTILSTVSRAYGALTTAQQASWKLFAQANPVTDAFGDPVTLTGHQMFTRLASVMQFIGVATPTAPPTSPGPASLLTASITANTLSTVTLAYTATPLLAGRRLAIWWTGPGTSSQDPNFNQARLIGYSPAAQASPYAVNLPASFTAGAVSNFYVSVVDASGRQSPPLKIRFTSAPGA